MNTPNEDIQRIADAARNSSEAELTAARVEVGTEALTVAWQFTGEPFLGYSTFGLYTDTHTFNAKFDGFERDTMSLALRATGATMCVDFRHGYSETEFWVVIPYVEWDPSDKQAVLELNVNGVMRGTLSGIVL